MNKLTVFTACNSKYEPFVLPYVLSVLYFNENTKVEISLERPKLFESENIEAIDILRGHLGNRFTFSRQPPLEVSPNSLRFLTTPQQKTEYVYIGDIDIIILEEIMTPHIENMKQTGLPYSNIKRPNKNALTGLHFSKWDAYYPIAAIHNKNLINLDEQLLYELICDRGLQLPTEEHSFRPIHGYHLSLSRYPTGPGIKWEDIQSEQNFRRYKKLKKSPIWLETAPLFHLNYRYLICTLEAVLCEVFPHLLFDFENTPKTKPSELWC